MPETSSPTGTSTVWRVRSKVGNGWVRGVVAGQPTITGMVEEAQQFRSAAEAAKVVKAINARRDLVPVEMVEGAATEQFVYGTPS